MHTAFMGCSYVVMVWSIDREEIESVLVFAFWLYVVLDIPAYMWLVVVEQALSWSNFDAPQSYRSCECKLLCVG